MGEPPPWSRILIIGLVALLPACAEPSAPTATVSGKTVWGEMAVEEVELRAFAVGPPPGPPVATAHSGYHGSFAVSLPPATYRIEARGSLPGPEGGRRILVGEVTVTVPSGSRRLDRVLLPLREEGGPAPQR